MDIKIVYNKNQKLEDIDNKIADILSEAFYSYIVRKGLLKLKTQHSATEIKTIDK